MFNKFSIPLWKETEIATLSENKSLKSLEMINTMNGNFVLIVMKNSLLFEFSNVSILILNFQEKGIFVPLLDLPYVIYKSFYDNESSIYFFTCDEENIFADFRYQILKFDTCLHEI